MIQSGISEAYMRKIPLEEKVGTILGELGTLYLQWAPLLEK